MLGSYDISQVESVTLMLRAKVAVDAVKVGVS